MRIAFCSVPGTEDRQYWSGTPYFMARQLKALFSDFVSIGPLQLFSQPFEKKHTLYTKVFEEGYLCELEPVLYRSLSAEVERRLRSLGDIDVIFSPGCLPYPNLFLETKIPVVFWADATFAGLLDIYPNYQNLCAENIWCGEQLQQLMLDKASVALFASSWAADSACNNYGVDHNKVRVIPFGANLHFTIEKEDELEHVLAQRETGTCRLLLVARQWHERSGDFAIAVLNAVQAAGVKATLTVAGCSIPDDRKDVLAGRVIAHPTLSKDGAGLEQSYTKLLASSHFLLHPSQSTCFGIGMCEANAWAVPVLAQDAGGIGSVITDGENGYKFPKGAGPEEYAKKIVELMEDRSSYLNLCRSSWQQYKARLNWSSSIRTIERLLQESL